MPSRNGWRLTGPIERPPGALGARLPYDINQYPPTTIAAAENEASSAW